MSSIENFRVIVDDIIRGAVLTATSEAMPVANLASPGRSRPWRSADLDPQTINAIYAAREVRGIALSHHNLTQDATVTVTLYNATVEVAEFVIPANHTRTWSAWCPAVESDECDILIDDPTNPAGYIEVVQAFAGPAVTVNCIHSRGAKVSWKKDKQHRYTRGQSLRSWGSGLVRRQAKIDLRFVEEADRWKLVQALAQEGEAHPLFYSMYPELGGTLEADHAFICKLVTDLDTDRWGGVYTGVPLEFWET